MPGKTALSQTGVSKSDAISATGDAFDTDLQAIIDAWPNLAEEARAKVLGIVQGLRR